MICPVCKKHYNLEQRVQTCVQCGADLEVHHLLECVAQNIKHGERPMTENTHAVPKVKPSIYPRFLELFQIMPAILLLGCAAFGIYVGLRFLNIVERVELPHTKTTTQWSDAGFEQLRQMTATIKQELDLIMAQRDENLTLQNQVKQLSAHVRALEKDHEQRMVLSPSAITEEVVHEEDN